MGSIATIWTRRQRRQGGVLAFGAPPSPVGLCIYRRVAPNWCGFIGQEGADLAAMSFFRWISLVQAGQGRYEVVAVATWWIGITHEGHAVADLTEKLQRASKLGIRSYRCF